MLKSGKSLHDNIAEQFMNSIFTNALPGQNEDSHIYTLKERFNQENANCNENNNNNYNNNQIMNEMHPRDQRDILEQRYKDYNDKGMMDDFDFNDYHSRSRHYNRSRSRSRIRERERERSRDRDRFRDRRENPRSRSKKFNSRSNSRNYRRNSPRMDDYRKRKVDNERNRDRDREREREKNMGRIYQKTYPPFSYIENGVTKINTYFTVPDHLVSLLIGKKGENVRAIMNSTGAVITFCKEVSFYSINIFNINYYLL